MNKYQEFFSEWKSFFSKLGVIDADNVKGYSHSEIITKLNEVGFTINCNGEYYAFLRVFGQQIKSKEISFINQYNKLEPRIEEYEITDTKEAKIEKWKKEIKNHININEKLHNYIGSDFLIIYYGDEGDHLIFTYPDRNELILGYYLLETNQVSIDTSIRWSFRTMIYAFLMISNSNDGKYMENIPWVKYYEKCKSECSSKMFYKNISRWGSHITYISKVEREQDKLYSIDELINSFFIDLIENHNAPYLPEIYDPYNDSRTFKEYLDKGLT